MCCDLLNIGKLLINAFFIQITISIFLFTSNHADTGRLNCFSRDAFLTFMCPVQYSGGECNVVWATPSTEKQLSWYNSSGIVWGNTFQSSNWGKKSTWAGRWRRVRWLETRKGEVTSGQVGWKWMNDWMNYETDLSVCTELLCTAAFFKYKAITHGKTTTVIPCLYLHHTEDKENKDSSPLINFTLKIRKSKTFSLTDTDRNYSPRNSWRILVLQKICLFYVS